MNGSTIRSALELAAVSGYVQQDDLFIGTLTVREHLKVQVSKRSTGSDLFDGTKLFKNTKAMLRMGKRFTNAEKMKRVEEVLDEVSLVSCGAIMLRQSCVLTLNN